MIANVVVAGKSIEILRKSHVASLGDGPVEIDDLISALEADHGPEFLSEGRRWAAEQAFVGGDNLASLRMKAGLSQAQLATRIGMKQPQLARIEAGKNDIQISMITRLARGLDVSETVAFEAAQRTRKEAGGVDG
jgi:DNA-binding XRE family transcriptional regulator